MTPLPQAPPRGMWALAGIFTLSGVLHLVRPRMFEAIVPHGLQAKRGLVHVSGVAELACAAGLAMPATRRPAGLVSAGLLVAIFPANVQMAADILKKDGRLAKILALARLPLQAPMVRTAWRTFHPKPPSLR